MCVKSITSRSINPDYKKNWIKLRQDKSTNYIRITMRTFLQHIIEKSHLISDEDVSFYRPVLDWRWRRVATGQHWSRQALRTIEQSQHIRHFKNNIFRITNQNNLKSLHWLVAVFRRDVPDQPASGSGQRLRPRRRDSVTVDHEI